MAGGNISQKKIRTVTRRYICRVRPMSAEEREGLKQRIIFELNRVKRKAGCVT